MVKNIDIFVMYAKKTSIPDDKITNMVINSGIPIEISLIKNYNLLKIIYSLCFVNQLEYQILHSVME